MDSVNEEEEGEEEEEEKKRLGNICVGVTQGELEGVLGYVWPQYVIYLVTCLI